MINFSQKLLIIFNLIFFFTFKTTRTRPLNPLGTPRHRWCNPSGTPRCHWGPDPPRPRRDCTHHPLPRTSSWPQSLHNVGIFFSWILFKKEDIFKWKFMNSVSIYVWCLEETKPRKLAKINKTYIFITASENNKFSSKILIIVLYFIKPQMT